MQMGHPGYCITISHFQSYISSTYVFSTASYEKLGNELNKSDQSGLIKFHIALQPTYPNMTHVRDCVTIRPPPNVVSDTDDQRVSTEPRRKVFGRDLVTLFLLLPNISASTYQQHSHKHAQTFTHLLFCRH